VRVHFLIAGVQKGGTTSLYQYLLQHPQVVMPDVKEVHFFDNDSNFEGCAIDYTRYHQYFPLRTGPRWIFGEATPIYTYWAPALSRIQAYNENMKLIVLLRNPAQRAWSHWRMERNRGKETLSFSEAIRAEPGRLCAETPRQHRIYSYLDRGLYGTQIRKIWSYFHKNQVLFLKSESFFERPDESVQRAFQFLGLDQTCIDTSVVHNQGPLSKPMPQEDAQYLREFFRNDIHAVAELLDWNCSDWLS
jgi:hypothetical protein